MQISLNVAIEHLKREAAVIDGMHEERVHLGPIQPSRVGDDPHIVIILNKNKGERIDGDKIKREILLTVSVMMRIDPVKGDADLQINEIYEPMHAAFEQMIDGVEGIMVAFTEVEDSLEYETQVIEGQALRFAMSDWLLTIDRTVGQTNLAN